MWISYITLFCFVLEVHSKNPWTCSSCVSPSYFIFFAPPHRRRSAAAAVGLTVECFSPPAETEHVSLAHLQLAHSMREEARKLEEFRVNQKESRKKVGAAGVQNWAPCLGNQVWCCLFRRSKRWTRSTNWSPPSSRRQWRYVKEAFMFKAELPGWPPSWLTRPVEAAALLYWAQHGCAGVGGRAKTASHCCERKRKVFSVGLGSELVRRLKTQHQKKKYRRCYSARAAEKDTCCSSAGEEDVRAQVPR